MKPVVIFDLDGVLVDSIPAHYETYRKLFARFGVRYSFREFVRNDITAGSMNVIPRVMKEHGKHANLHDAMKEKNYIITKENVPLHDGVPRLLKELKKNGYRMSVASGGSTVFVHRILKKHKVTGYFESILTGDDGVRKKPFPDIYLKTAKAMKVKPRDCVVIEDSHDGMLAAKRAGMRVIGHKNKGHGQDLAKADKVVHSMTKITIEMIEKIANR
jgi:HAD superfamily hydrolase (TIGR01509 family)